MKGSGSAAINENSADDNRPLISSRLAENQQEEIKTRVSTEHVSLFVCSGPGPSRTVTHGPARGGAGPKPSSSEVQWESAKKLGIFNIKRTKALLEHFAWKPTVVCGSKKLAGPSSGSGDSRRYYAHAELERLDGVKILLKRDSGCLLYVINEATGLEYIWVTDIFSDSGASDKPDKVRFVRVLSTRDALMQATEEDCRDPSLQGNIGGTRLGKKSLRFEQESWQKSASRSVAVYHRGDLPYESDIGNIVGVVAFQPCREHPNTSLLLTRVKGAIRIKGLSDINHVLLGADFSEPKPEARTKRGRKRD